MVSDNSDSKRQQLVMALDAGDVSEIDGWLAALNDCRSRTIKAVADIKQDELDRDCPEVSRNTIGTLLYHIAAIEIDWMYSDILEEPFPEDFRSWFPRDVRDSDGNLTRITGESIEHHLARFDYVRSRLVGALRDMPAAEFERIRHLEEYDVSPRWVLCHLLQHEAEHRGQIGILCGRFVDGSED